MRVSAAARAWSSQASPPCSSPGVRAGRRHLGFQDLRQPRPKSVGEQEAAVPTNPLKEAYFGEQHCTRPTRWTRTSAARG